MSASSERVKRWRKNTKSRIIESMGGSCQVCGYSKCHAALALHHIDPAEKEFSFGAMRASPKNWQSIVVELRKCVLVCHNCHTEIHDGVTDVPKLVKGFDESFVTYARINK